MGEDEGTSLPGNVVRIDEERIKDHLGRIVRGTVEDTLNALLDAEADRLCKAKRHERTEARRDTRAGSYPRKLHTRAGEVSLRVPKLRRQAFETAIIERYRRRESSVEEALIEMYLAGVSVRRVEDITEALWGTRVSPSAVSRLNQKIYGQIEAWRNRPITGTHPYVYLDGVVLKRSWAGEVRNVSLLVAIGVSAEGFREILGICEGAKEDRKGWSGFLAHLKQRGLTGIELIVSDACLGLVESAAEHFPEARWQRCVVGPLKKFVLVCGLGGGAAVMGRRSLERCAGDERDRDDEPSMDDHAGGHDQTAEQRRGEPLEVDGGRREEGLDAHVLQAAPNRSAQLVPGFRLAMKAFRAPAVALVEPGVGLGPAVLAAAGAQKGGVVVADHHSLVGPPLGQAVAAHRAASAVRRA